MANHKSAKKRSIQNIKRNMDNKWKTSRMRTELKKIRTLIEENNKEEALKTLPKVQSLISKLAKSSALHKKTASRKISRIAAQVASLK